MKKIDDDLIQKFSRYLTESGSKFITENFKEGIDSTIKQALYFTIFGFANAMVFHLEILESEIKKPIFSSVVEVFKKDLDKLLETFFEKIDRGRIH